MMRFFKMEYFFLQNYRQFFQICLKPYLQRHDFIGFQDFGQGIVKISAIILISELNIYLKIDEIKFYYRLLYSCLLLVKIHAI